jgi:hypothetical protein
MTIALLPFRRRLAGDLFIHDFLCFKDKYLWAIEEDIPPGLDLKSWINEQIKDDGLEASAAISFQLSPITILVLAEVDIEEKKFMYEGHVPMTYDEDLVWFQVIDIPYPIEGDLRRVMNPNWIDYYSKLYNNRSGFSSYQQKDFFKFKENTISLQFVLMILAEEYRTKMIPEIRIISDLTRKMKGLGI